MEVRCGKCNKLFRVPDSKISGTGIKFSCTGCGEYVKITKEEFDHHSPSQIIVSIPDKVEPKPQPVDKPLPPEGGRSTVTITTSVVEPKIPEVSTPDAPSDIPKKEIPAVAVSSPSAESMRLAEPAPAPSPEPQKEPVKAFKAEPKIEPQQEQPNPALKPGPVPIPEPQPAIVQAPTIEPKAEPKPEPMPAPAPRSRVESAAVSKSTHEPVRSTAPVMTSSVPSIPSGAPKKERVRPVPHSTMKKTPPDAPERSGRMFIVLIVAFVMIGFAVYGVFAYLGSGSKKGKEAVEDLSSIEGLHITSALGSREANGDLLITGVVENTTGMEKSAWYVVVEVYNAQGAALNKIRLLNGKQLFTRRDYEILAKRGVNIQDLKEKSIQEHGVILPPQSSVTFEIRYVQPPAGIASFNVTLQPFDPVRLFKEIAADIK